MPAGSETMQFTSHAAGEHVPGWVLLPLVYRDDDENPTCTIGINIHGHSIKDIYVPLSYNDLASMVYSLIDHCVAPMNQGGIMTYGLPFVTYMMRNRPVTYHSRFPYNPSHREAWGGENIPSYLSITVSGNTNLQDELNDPTFQAFLTTYLRQAIDPSAAENTGAVGSLLQNLHNCPQDSPVSIKQEPLAPQASTAEICSGTCTSVNRQCSHRASCSCYAQKVSLVSAIFFWHTARCGPARITTTGVIGSISGGADGGSRFKRSGHLTAYEEIAAAPAGNGSSSTASASIVAWNALPAPCNASYISYACANSSDGIVHEPPEKWLGALLPANATELPPVPSAFLRIHGMTGLGSSENATSGVQ